MIQKDFVEKDGWTDLPITYEAPNIIHPDTEPIYTCGSIKLGPIAKSPINTASPKASCEKSTNKSWHS